MAGEVLKATAFAFGAAYGAHATFAWLTARGGLAKSVTDIDPAEFFPATFAVLTIALILS